MRHADGVEQVRDQLLGRLEVAIGDVLVEVERNVREWVQNGLIAFSSNFDGGYPLLAWSSARLSGRLRDVEGLVRQFVLIQPELDFVFVQVEADEYRSWRGGGHADYKKWTS